MEPPVPFMVRPPALAALLADGDPSATSQMRARAKANAESEGRDEAPGGSSEDAAARMPATAAPIRRYFAEPIAMRNSRSRGQNGMMTARSVRSTALVHSLYQEGGWAGRPRPLCRMEDPPMTKCAEGCVLACAAPRIAACAETHPVREAFDRARYHGHPDRPHPCRRRAREGAVARPLPSRAARMGARPAATTRPRLRRHGRRRAADARA